MSKIYKNEVYILLNKNEIYSQASHCGTEISTTVTVAITAITVT